MKTRILLLLGLLLPFAAAGQVSNPSIISVATAPSGACNAGLPNQQVVSTGVQYSCQAGTWAAVGSGGGAYPGVTSDGANGLVVGGVVRTVSPRAPGLIAFGDSICAGLGASVPGNSFVSKLFAQLGGTLSNYCVGGDWIEDEPTQMFVGGPSNPTLAQNPTNIEQGGKNDSSGCAGNANCNATAMLALQTVIGWRGTSTSNIVLPSAATESGTWVNDSVISSCRATTTNGSSATYSITTFGSSAIGITVRAYDGNGGTGSVSIDSVSQTGFITSGVGGASIIQGARPSVFTYMYPVSAGTHSVVITDTAATSSSNLVAVCGLVSGNDPAKANFTAPPRVWSMEVIPFQGNINPTYTSTINAAKQATVNQMAAYGFNVTWAPVTNVPFTGAFNSANFISNQPSVFDADGLSCAGDTTDTTHPNDCGHKAIFQALMSDILPDTSGAGASAVSPGSLALTQANTNANYTLQTTDGVLAFSGSSSYTVTLPNLGSLKTGPYLIENTGTGTITLAPASGASMNDTPTSLPPFSAVIITNFGANWFAAGAFNLASSTCAQALISANYTVNTNGDCTLYVSGTVTITLPTAQSSHTGPYYIVNYGTGLVTIVNNGIYGIPSSLNPGASIAVSNLGGTNWLPVGAFNLPGASALKSSSFTLTSNVSVYAINGAGITATLPSTLASGGPYTFINYGTSAVTISASGTGTMPATLPAGASVVFFNFGSNWELGSTLPLVGTTGSIGGGALTAGTCASGTVSVTGSTTAMPVTVSPVTYPGDAFTWEGYVSAAGTVTVKVCTNFAAGGTPTASTYNVRVIQ